MKLRKNILPRRLVDLLCFLLIGVFLPIVYVFEMVVVLPEFHEPGGFFHTFTFAVGIFILFNIKANMLACMLIDTSVSAVGKTNKPPIDNKNKGDGDSSNEWRHCAACNLWTPPRSWHCKVCKTCILKRDHHCLFTACCIGQRNHRYFVMFVIFLFIGATYCFVYNSIYLWVLKAHLYRNLLSVLKMTCPLLMVVSGSAWQNAYLVFYNLNILAMAYSVLLILYHGPMVWQGGICYERGSGYIYNRGWRKNLQSILGNRMHLVWLSPLISSELPDDGVQWQITNEGAKKKKSS